MSELRLTRIDTAEVAKEISQRLRLLALHLASPSMKKIADQFDYALRQRSLDGGEMIVCSLASLQAYRGVHSLPSLRRLLYSHGVYPVVRLKLTEYYDPDRAKEALGSIPRRKPRV